MKLNIPFHINFGIVLIAFACIWLLYIAAKKAPNVFYLCVCWVLIQASAAYTGFYLMSEHKTLQFILSIILPTSLILALLLNKKGRWFVNFLNQEYLTYIFALKIPLQYIMHWLFKTETMPMFTTMSIQNIDLLIGLSAPLVAYYGIKKGKIPLKGIIIWNIFSLSILINIIISALIFDNQDNGIINQGDVMIFQFPFIWIPSFIVPIFIFAHISLLKQLSMKRID